MRRSLRESIEGLVGSSAIWFAENNNTAPPTAASIFELPEIFFVFTDIEDSTVMAAADPETYGCVLVHFRLFVSPFPFHYWGKKPSETCP